METDIILLIAGKIVWYWRGGTPVYGLYSYVQPQRLW